MKTGGRSELINNLEPLNLEPHVYEYLLRTVSHFKLYKRLRDLPSQSLTRRRLNVALGGRYSTQVTVAILDALQCADLVDYRCVQEQNGWSSYMIKTLEVPGLIEGKVEFEARDTQHDVSGLLGHYSYCHERSGLPGSETHHIQNIQLASTILQRCAGSLDEAKALVDLFFSQPSERVNEYSFRGFYNSVGRLMLDVQERREIRVAVKRQNREKQAAIDKHAATAAESGRTVEEYDAWVAQNHRDREAARGTVKMGRTTAEIGAALRARRARKEANEA